MLFIIIFTCTLGLCHLVEYNAHLKFIQKDKERYHIKQLSITLLNCIIQDFLIDYFVTNLEYHFTLFNIINGTVMFYFQDVYFYFGHRLMHSKRIYKYFHKMHHYYKSPNFWCCYYEHPIDHILVWVLPYLIIPYLLNINFYIYWFVVFITTLLSIEGHSGNDHSFKYWYIEYIFGIKTDIFSHNWLYNHSYHHDTHHLKTNCNYGLYTTLLDRVFGTLYINHDKCIIDNLKSEKQIFNSFLSS